MPRVAATAMRCRPSTSLVVERRYPNGFISVNPVVRAQAVRRAVFRRIPPSRQVALLRISGRGKPWDQRATLEPPRCPPDHAIGPPDFVGVGAQKSGTSWWYSMILDHPGVWRPAGRPKELHFFARFWESDLGPPGTGTPSYQRWFPRPPGQLVGEWTPGYLAQYWVPDMLHRVAPEARLLILLRDPVERYRSGITHHGRRHRLDSRAADDACRRGFYAQQLRWLYRCFDPQQVLVLQFERCRLDPGGELERTFAFLGLANVEVERRFETRVNPTTGPKIGLSDERRKLLVDLYSPDVEELLRLVPGLDVTLWPNFPHLE